MSAAALAKTPLLAQGHIALCEALAIAPEIPWVIDLSLGAWRPREAARQLAAQANLTLPAGPAPAANSNATWAAIVGANIDNEARGPTQVHVANADAALLHTALHDGKAACVLVVWLPLFDDLPDDNGWFLRLLGARLKASGGRLVLARRTPGVGALPGAACLEPHLFSAPAAAAHFYQLRGGQFLCCPSQRPAAWPPPSPSCFDQMASRPETPAWLRAYAACYGSSYFVQSEALSDHAWSCHAEGAMPLAMLLLQRARVCARDPVQRATILARIQGIRIASQQFADAAQEAAPAPNLPVPLRQFLRQTIGWARIMNGDTEGLAAYFDKPASDPVAGREQLYAMNIHALGLARSGQSSEALDMELRIEQARRDNAIDDARLAYINHLNIARLYKLRGQLDEAERHYEAAFATNYGVRAHAESAHAGWIRASMARATGRPQNAGAWLMHAVLHWLVDPLPEAVPIRLAQAVLGARLPPEDERPDAMSAAMLRALLKAVDDGELACAAAGAGPAPGFVSMTPGLAVSHYFGWPGCSVGWRGVQPPPGPERDRAHAALAALAGQVLAGAAGTPGTGGSVVVDDQGGRDLPRARGELLALALARGATACTWQGEQVGIGSACAQTLQRKLALRRSAALAALEQADGGLWQLRYLRHGRVHQLGTSSALLIGRLEREGQLCIDALNDTDIQTDNSWSDAWASGAVDLSLSEQACIQAGISWHTNAT
jgi:tetratricopeptide (TPR) repeat protein